MNEQLYLIYDDTGGFHGFFHKETADKLSCENDELHKAPVSKNMHKYLINCDSDFLINVNMLKTSETEIDAKEFITITPDIIDDDMLKRDFVGKIKSRCGSYITSGADVELSTGETKHFSFKIEDQINLAALAANHSDGNMVYYHADEENDTLYSYADIVTIYKTLYNNKIYNQIYAETLCTWINSHLTAEVLEERQSIISYGFCTDDMRERIGELYDSQKLL